MARTYVKNGRFIEVTDVREVKVQRTLKQLRGEKQQLLATKKRIQENIDLINEFIQQALALQVEEEQEIVNE